MGRAAHLQVAQPGLLLALDVRVELQAHALRRLAQRHLRQAQLRLPGGDHRCDGRISPLVSPRLAIEKSAWPRRGLHCCPHMP